jgi:hypothetical protein
VALKSPEGVACGADAVFVADTGNARLVRFKLQNGLPVGATQLKLSELQQPTIIHDDGKGGLLVLDRKARKVARISAQLQFAGWVEVKGSEQQEVLPISFKPDGAGGIVLLDGAGRRVLFLDGSGAITRQVPLPKGEFTDIAVDASGVLYAVDEVEAVIWSAAKGDQALKPLSKNLKDVANFPASLIATGRGTLLVVDQHGHGIVTVGIDGSFQGRQLDMGWNEGVLYYPSTLCITSAGEVLIADRGNNRVQVFATPK